MCNHIYKSKDLEGVKCHFSHLFERSGEKFQDDKQNEIVTSLPHDSQGSCIFHSNDVAWKRCNDFTKYFLLLPNLIEADDQVRNCNFVEFVVVGKLAMVKKGVEQYEFKVHEQKFKKEISLISCDFIDPVHFEFVDFLRGLNLEGSKFNQSVVIKQCTFQGFRSDNAVYRNSLSLSNVKIQSYSLMDSCQFIGGIVLFVDTEFDGITSFVGSCFHIESNAVVNFKKSWFKDVADFTNASFRCQVVFEKTSFAGTTDFVDTYFGHVESTARYRGSALEFDEIEVLDKAEIIFKGSDGKDKIFNHDVHFSFKLPIEGHIHFENANFSRISKVAQAQLLNFQRKGNATIGSGCIKYRFQTKNRTLSVSESNAPLIIELCQTFSQYFTVSNGLNLGFEVVERRERELIYFYFTDENITEDIFLSRLSVSEQGFWNILSSFSLLKNIDGSHVEPREISVRDHNMLINSVDTLTTLLGIFFRASVRIQHNTWNLEDTRSLLSSMNFDHGYDLEERANNLHSALITRYTLEELQDINTRQNIGLLPPAPAPNTLLFLSANPLKLSNLKLGDEMKRISKSLRGSSYRDYFRVESYWDVDTTELADLVGHHSPIAVHFSGHGDNNGRLIFQNELGLKNRASKRAITKLFSLLGSNVRCVVLNACYSVSQANLIIDYVDVVIGVSGKCPDEAAIIFSETFYSALGNGISVFCSYELALLTLNFKNYKRASYFKICHRPEVDPNNVYLIPDAIRQSSKLLKSS